MDPLRNVPVTAKFSIVDQHNFESFNYSINDFEYILVINFLMKTLGTHLILLISWNSDKGAFARPLLGYVITTIFIFSHQHIHYYNNTQHTKKKRLHLFLRYV